MDYDANEPALCDLSLNAFNFSARLLTNVISYHKLESDDNGAFSRSGFSTFSFFFAAPTRALPISISHAEKIVNLNWYAW